MRSVSNAELWELIDISHRSCAFYVFRPGMSLCTLICEDLARIDPVQTVIRSVGPNLVVALLMDGPQVEGRWAYRYATVLADDPGSAVLIGTSMGFLRRQGSSDPDVPREVVLWKGAEARTKTIKLPAGHQALVLTLSSAGILNFSLDGRSDEGATHGISLSECLPVKHPSPPEWAKNE